MKQFAIFYASGLKLLFKLVKDFSSIEMHALRRQRLLGLCCQCVRTQWQVPCRAKRSKHRSDEISSLFVPVLVKPSPDDINVGAELSEKLRKQDMQRVLVQFHQREEVKSLCLENGLDSKLPFKIFFGLLRVYRCNVSCGGDAEIY